MTVFHLHFGTHKTGTTAIQDTLAAHRETLLQRGLLYPDYRPLLDAEPSAHHEFAKAITGQSKTISLSLARDLVAHWAAQAEKHKADVLISAEPMYRLIHRDDKGQANWLDARSHFLKSLANIFSAHETRAVIVFRRPDDFARSMYQENTMLGQREIGKTFRQYRKTRQNTLFCYGTNARLIKQHFPATQALLYEELSQGEGLINNFLRQFGMDPGDLGEIRHVRKSLTVPETRVKAFLNLMRPSKKDNRRLLTWLKSPFIQRALGEHYPDRHWELWRSFEERIEFLRLMEEEIEILRSECFPDRHQLFDAPTPDQHGNPAPPPSDKLKAQLLGKALFGKRTKKMKGK